MRNNRKKRGIVSKMNHVRCFLAFCIETYDFAHRNLVFLFSDPELVNISLRIVIQLICDSNPKQQVIILIILDGLRGR